MTDPAEVAASYLASFATGDPERIAAWVDEDFVNHHTSALGSSCQGRTAYRERLPGFLSEFNGLTFQLLDTITEQNRVAVSYLMRANHHGSPIEIEGAFHLTVSGGLIIQRTDYFDSLTFLQQTGQQ